LPNENKAYSIEELMTQFTVDITFIMIIWGVPLIIDVVLIIISINKIKNGKNPK